MTKLTGWSGEAVVLGRLVLVEFSEDAGLRLKGINADVAMEVLDKLKTPGILGVNPAKVTRETGPFPTVTEKEVLKAADPVALAALEASKVVAVSDLIPVKSMTVAEFAATAAVEVVAKRKRAPMVDVPAEKPAETAPAAPAVEKAAAPAGDMLEALRAANKLRDVLAVLHDNGITEAAQVIAKCEELKAQVPLLARIGNLGERIQRTLEVFGA